MQILSQKSLLKKKQRQKSIAKILFPHHCTFHLWYLHLYQFIFHFLFSFLFQLCISFLKKQRNKKASRFVNGCFKYSRTKKDYSDSATTSFTSGIIRFIIPSIPAFKVIIDEGQPLQLPCNIRFTVPSS